MSKNLSKASDWAQREIDDLREEYSTLEKQRTDIEARMKKIDEKRSNLIDLVRQLNSNVSETKSPEKVNDNQNGENK
jgi:predicted  nucleic acid-binding Zn-ribbon protein